MSETLTLPTVTLHHPDGRYVIVNAVENDADYQTFVHLGYVICDADKSRLKPSSFSSENEELRWRIANLESEISRLKDAARMT